MEPVEHVFAPPGDTSGAGRIGPLRSPAAAGLAPDPPVGPAFLRRDVAPPASPPFPRHQTRTIADYSSARLTADRPPQLHQVGFQLDLRPHPHLFREPEL